MNIHIESGIEKIGLVSQANGDGSGGGDGVFIVGAANDLQRC